MSSAETHAFDDVRVGHTASQDYAITPAVYEAFLGAFDDRSPVHVDEGYARAAGFEGRVMHGAILNGFLSHFIGMRFPGARALLLSADIRYTQPSFLGDRIRLTATVTQKVESQRVLALNVAFHNETRGATVARGRVQVGLRNA